MSIAVVSHQPATGRKEGKDVVSDCRVWSETAKDGDECVKENRKRTEYYYYYYYYYYLIFYP